VYSDFVSELLLTQAAGLPVLAQVLANPDL
jgi:hypothetical protein